MCSFCLLAVSYNQPKFCSNALWEPNATTFTNNTTVLSEPYGIFVDTNDTVYVPDRENGRILLWFNGSNNVTTTILDGVNLTFSLFVTIHGDIYVDNGYLNKTVDKWIWNANTSVIAMHVSGTCYDLFVDINDTLYCSMADFHQVVATSLNSNLNTTKIVAGTGCPGLTQNMLYNPQGIFVHINLSLYVADCGNDRIQVFQYEQLNAITIVGNGAPDNIGLDCPSGVVLDANNYLFIVDQYNNRIVGSEANGFRCLAGCSGIAGSASNQLYNPQSMAFDSHGNMFVTDRNNNRIQKFILATNSCGKCNNK
jgi:hypothetical protein